MRNEGTSVEIDRRGPSDAYSCEIDLIIRGALVQEPTRIPTPPPSNTAIGDTDGRSSSSGNSGPTASPT